MVQHVLQQAQSKNQTAREVGQLPAAQGQIAVSPVGLGLTKLDPKKPLVPKKPPSSSPLASPLPRDHHPTVLAHRPRTFLTSVSEALTARQVPVSTRAKPTCMYIKSVPLINNHRLSKTREMLSSTLRSSSYRDDSRSTTEDGMSSSACSMRPSSRAFSRSSNSDLITWNSSFMWASSMSSAATVHKRAAANNVRIMRPGA
mmetsp:Transcript_17376/g.41159  ORF Transcript_17376/g.41159 Transcript_17376/m.41159 type:complete len:201 (-) Transcript_17376:30-632(-)